MPLLHKNLIMARLKEIAKPLSRLYKAKQTYEDQALAALFENSEPLTIKTHPEFYFIFETICKNHGVKQLPHMRLGKFLPCVAYAVPKQDTIILGSDFDAAVDLKQQLSIAFHEFGHILCDHNGPSQKEWEHAADRLTVQFMEERQPWVKFIKEHNSLIEMEKKQFAQAGLAGKIINWSRSARQKREYGSFAERIANIEESPVQPNERFRELVAKRNQSDISAEL